MRGLLRLWPAAALLVGAAALWLGARAAAWRVAGPPGFDVVTRDRAGVEVAHARAGRLLTPEVAPTPPPGGSLVAGAPCRGRRAGE